MDLVGSFQGKTLKCVKKFAFFEKGHTYYCIYDTGEYFYIWCHNSSLPVNEIKLHKECKTNFKQEQF